MQEGYPEEWMTPKKTIREHLDYKFIMALEGNDVASNLKWVMSSNSYQGKGTHEYLIGLSIYHALGNYGNQIPVRLEL